MARFFRPPIAIGVREDGRGLPAGIISRGKAMRVTAVRDRWRVREGWWRGEEVWREYFEVLTDRSAYLIFRDLPAGGWYLQRAYD